MGKNLKITLFFLSVIISLLITIINYFGLDRYYTLKNSSQSYTSSLVDNYKNLTKYDERIVISLSSNDITLENLRPMLNSLLDQTISVDRIYLHLPPLEGQSYIIPEDYNNFLSINNLRKNYGYGNNIIPLLLISETEINTKIIYLDNNNIYGKDFIQKIVEKSNNFPDNVIGVRDQKVIYANLVKPKFFSSGVISSSETTVYDENWIDSHINPSNYRIYLDYTENYIY
jgi:hypothetical protein